MREIAVFGGVAHPALAAEICADLGVPQRPVRFTRFANDCLEVQLVVSRGGGPDLAAQVLPRVHQPVLLIISEKGPAVLELNRQAMQKLAGETELVIVPGASHLFEESGALEHVAQLARDWFLEHLT